jgi:hypothetical protein
MPLNLALPAGVVGGLSAYCEQNMREIQFAPTPCRPESLVSIAGR